MEKFKRLEILIHLLESRPYLSKDEMIDYLMEYHELDISPRTLERDFRLLEMDFSITVKYDRLRRGYHLVKEDREQISSFLAFTGRVYIAELFRKGLKDFEGLRKSIKLEDYSEFKGIVNIETTYIAIKQKRIITFKHENYIKSTTTSYRIAPFQLREYQGRWYVVGVPLSSDDKPINEKVVKNFGLARCSQLEIRHIHYLKKDDFKEEMKKYKYIIGLNYNEAEKRILVKIAVTSQQYKYLKSLPIHPSQRFIEDLKNRRKLISYFLIPNFEFKMQLLKLGHRVEVLSPPELRNEIKTELEQTIKLYNNENKD